MFFRRKNQLKKQYDALLLDTMSHLKTDWEKQKKIQKLVHEDTPDLYVQRKLSEAKYFYLFKEAKIRNLRGKL